MTLIVDASVAVKWVQRENLSEQAIDLFQSDQAILAPDLIVSEIANVLWKRSRKGQIHGARVGDLLRTATRDPLVLLPTAALVPRALELAVELDHPVYDCVYLAAAEQHDAVLVTADAEFLTAVCRSRYKSLAAHFSHTATTRNQWGQTRLTRVD